MKRWSLLLCVGFPILLGVIVGLLFWGKNQQITDSYLQAALREGMSRKDVLAELLANADYHPEGADVESLKVAIVGVGGFLVPQRNVTIHFSKDRLQRVTIEVKYLFRECNYALPLDRR